MTGWLNNHRIGSAVTVLAIGALCLVMGMTYVFAALVQKLAEASQDAAGSRKKKDQKEFLIRCLLPIMAGGLASSARLGVVSQNTRPPTARSHGGGSSAPASF